MAPDPTANQVPSRSEIGGPSPPWAHVRTGRPPTRLGRISAMSPPSEPLEPGSGKSSEARRAARRFFLAQTPDQGSPELERTEQEHALKVVRVQSGEALVGLDGEGGAWPLEVVRAERRTLELRSNGPVVREPAPGEPGAVLPAIEIVSAIPRSGRAEDMLDRLTQLGVATWTPWITERSSAAARDLAGGRRERLLRRVREACKQSRGSWPLVIGEPATTAELCARGLEDRLGWLDPTASQGLAAWAQERVGRPASAAQSIVLAIGPEGGLTSPEAAALAAAGAHSLTLGPHVLRIETAAEATAAIVAHLCL